MKKYDPQKPLISIHIPKCAGGSLRRLLKKWFGRDLHKHYFQQYNALPPKHDLKPGICIHGHFNRTKGFGIRDYYPEVDQFITFLRNPVEIVVSNYFFWKRKGRDNQIKRRTLKEGDDHDYKDISDFFKKRPKSHILDYMPYEMTMDNYRDVLEESFVYVGIVEDLHTSVNILANKLGFMQIEVERVNVSNRNEEVPEDMKERFVNNNHLAYAIYNYALERYKK